MTAPKARSGRVAIVGPPNVGKSTLLNALLGQKLAIATPKPQTTRTSLLGVYVSNDPPAQIAFIDTPGLHDPRNALGRALVEEAKAGLADADVVVMVCDASRMTPERPLPADDLRVLETIKLGNQPIILAINKIDKVKDKTKLLPVLEACGKKYPLFAALVPIGARRGDNLKGLIREVSERLPEGEIDAETPLTDKPERFFAAELIREAAIAQTRQEVPYGVAVVIDTYVDEPTITRIQATVVVNKEAHKAIIIGKGGLRLKEIGTAARHELEAMIERKVYMELWVKVKEGWTENPVDVRELTQSGADEVG